MKISQWRMQIFYFIRVASAFIRVRKAAATHPQQQSTIHLALICIQSALCSVPCSEIRARVCRSVARSVGWAKELGWLAGVPWRRRFLSIVWRNVPCVALLTFHNNAIKCDLALNRPVHFATIKSGAQSVGGFSVTSARSTPHIHQAGCKIIWRSLGDIFLAFGFKEINDCPFNSSCSIFN